MDEIIINDGIDIIDRENGLEKMSALLRQHEGAIGRKKLDLFLSPEKNDPENGWTTTKIVAMATDKDRMVFSRKMFLDNPDRDLAVGLLFSPYLPESDSKARVDADIFSIECSIVKMKGRTLVLFQTTGLAKHILGKSGDGRVDGFSVSDDEEFAKLTLGGMMTEKIFIDVKTGKVQKILSAYMDMEPTERIERNVGGATLEFDLRDLYKRRKMRKVERGMDGKLVVKEGELIDGKKFEWK